MKITIYPFQYCFPILFSLVFLSKAVAQANFAKLVNDELVTATGPALANAWGDFNNDGYEDLYVCNYANYNNFLFRNNGDGTFTRMTNLVVEEDYADSYAARWGDYDNDGYIDLFVANHNGTNLLYHNNGGVSLTKVTTGTIVTDSTMAWDAAWVDYDNDRFLDVFVTGNQKNYLYRNLGNSTFERVEAGPITKDSNASFSCTWGDYNNDGYQDLFVANYGNQNNCLYRNVGNGKFEKILSGSIVNDGGQSRSASWGDYNNDGFLDLYVTNSGQAPFLYKNNGNGTFSRIMNDPLVSDDNWSYSATWSDFDNDGYLDVFVVNSISTDSVSLFRNNQNGTFSKIKANSLFAGNSSSWSVSACDYDNNGRPDVYVASRGFNKSYLFINQSTENNYVGISLKGTVSNKSAIGARVEVKSKNGSQTQFITANHGRGSQNGLRLIFGMGKTQSVDTIRITWPSKTIQTLVDFPVNAYYSFVECSPKLVPITKTICPKDSLYFGGSYLKVNGTYSQTYHTAAGCDSTIALTLNIAPLYTHTIDTTICYNCSYYAQGALQTIPGTYRDTLSSVNGCDSILITKLKVEILTSLSTQASSSKILVYPNPTNGLVSIKADNLAYYEVYSASGMFLFRKNGFDIDFSNLDNGLYIILLLDKSGRVTREKVIKQVER